MNSTQRCILALVSCLLAGCYFKSTVEPIGPAASVLPVPLPNNPCKCVDAKPMQLVVNFPDASLNYAESVTLAGTTTTTIKGPVDYSQSPLWLGCSIQPDPPAAPSCNKQYSWSVSPQYKYALTARQLKVLRQPTRDLELNCDAQCADDAKPWPYCVRLTKGTEFQKKYAAKLTALQRRLRDPATTSIEYSELADSFGLGTTCTRQALFVNGDLLTNSGGRACGATFKVDVDNPSIKGKAKTPQTVTLAVNPDVSSRLVHKPGTTEVDLLFPDPTKSIFVTFHDADWDESYGGAVSFIHSYENSVILRTSQACTVVPLK
jgi:hypothetical protein